MISFDVIGRAAPQGSKHARPIYTGRGSNREFTGRVATVESSRYVKPWRVAVFTAARMASLGRPDFVTMTGPVRLDVTFVLARPKSHYRTGSKAHLLRPDAPAFPGVAPDLSKLVRSTEDAITEAGLWRDDALVTYTVASKVYVGDPSGPSEPGARITIREVTA